MKFRKGEWERTLNGKQVLNLNSKQGLDEYLRRTHEMRERQHNMCSWCSHFMPKDDVTFDHTLGRGMGGANRDDRIWIDGKPVNSAMHFRCNIAKGSTRIVPEYLEVP